MNLLGNILKSSQRGQPRPWYSHRYIGRLLLLAIIIFCYEYYSNTQPRSFKKILSEQVLNVGYIKSPETAFENNHNTYGLQYDILSDFAEQHLLTIKLHQISETEALLGLNTNQFDLLIGHFPKHTNQLSTPLPISSINPFKKSLKNKLLSGKEALIHYRESEPWYHSNTVIFEYKAAKTPKTNAISVKQPIFYENGFPIQNINTSNLNFKSIQQNSLFESVSNNDIQFGVSTLIKLRINQKFIPKLRTIKTYKEKVPLVWLFPHDAEPDFLNEINTFIHQEKTQQLIKDKSLFWFKKYQYINHLDILSIYKNIQSKLNQLQPVFIRASKIENIEWSLLAAIAYQESNWNIDAISPTNVKGIMQLTQATANDLGVKNRTDPNESILAAAKYIRLQEKIVPIRVKRSDRIWLAVAAYNLGRSKILQAYKSVQLEKTGEITWQDISKKLTNKSESFKNNKYSTGKRAVEYVERIREFQEVLRYYASK